MLSQINDAIKIDQDKITELSMNVESLNEKITSSVIKAPVDGIINIINPVNRGDILQSGIELSSIIPNVSPDYKLEIYISNKDFGNIKEGQNVLCNFLALPQRDYGAVGTNISSLSADSKINQKDGSSYYIATAELKNEVLTNHKGEGAQLKPGMLFEAQIVNRRVSYLNYFLEKLN